MVARGTSVLGIGSVYPYAAYFVSDDQPGVMSEPAARVSVGTRNVVLVYDQRWPTRPGVCCWRASVHSVFTDLGLDVHEVAWSPAQTQAAETDDATPTPAARTPSVPGVVLRFIGRAIRAIGYGFWRLFRRLARPFARPVRAYVRRLRANRQRTDTSDSPKPAITRSIDGDPDPRLTALSEARLVIVESAEAAVAAVRSGVPKPVVWLLAVPPERAAAGEPVPWAGELRDAAPRIGGLLVDSTDAAGVLERVVGPVRTAVLPPLAADRECPECLASKANQDDATAETTGGAAVDASPIDPYPKDVPGHLELWQRLLTGPAEPTPYSFPVARVRGEGGPWTETKRAAWGDSARYDRLTELTPTWTVDAQLAGARQLLTLLPETKPRPTENDNGSLRVRVFGYDMKFMRELVEALDVRPDLDVQIDEWPSAGARNNGITENLARSAHTLVAEWARPNAIWLSENKRPDQTLVVRLHRFEIESYYPKRIKESAVDAMVYIAPLMGRRIRDELGWPVEKLVYVPNYVDTARLDRPKHPDARFTLGMVGIVPGLKRFDLALDLLAAVREADPRFSLLVRSQMGWAHKPSWENPDERRELQRAMERIEKDPLLRGAVVFDAFGRDMASWFRKVGHILSLSDVEGSHTSLTEGMASGAVPVIRPWDGAAEAYGETNLSESLEHAVAQVLADVDPEVWRARSEQAKQDMLERFDPAGVVEAWAELVRGDVEAARARFAKFSGLPGQP